VTIGEVTRPIRVGFVLHVMQVAGAEVLVAETIRRLGDHLDPVVLCLDNVGQLGEELLASGVPVVALGRRPGFDLGVARQLAREIERRQLEVVHAHQYTPFFYAALAKLIARRKPHLIFTEHGRHYPDVVSWKRRLINRLLLARQANQINGVCRFSTTSLARVDGFGAKQIDVIPNGIDLPRYATESRETARQQLGLQPDTRYVTCVARFHPVKDHAMLLRAFAATAMHVPRVELLLAGDGPLRQALENQARDLGIADKVRFLGIRNDVATILRASDVFALTSVSEAASLTLLEALASHLPVVVTAVGGNPEIVEDGVHGYLVPRGDDAAATRAFVALLKDPGRSAVMGAAGRRLVSEHYQLGQTIETYGRLYAAAAGRIGPPAARAVAAV
jgi:glycosyltransferase involved in cell wall biosynthesis